ncbi:5'-3' exoribonuclease [Chloropicon primus]|nr:5'-3' exoribonuclease [Chloropicon primus]
MGVPKFYRWLSERYPLVNHNVSETQVPPVDNFFLDMNGIIHNCTHGNDEDATKHLSEAEMVVKIFTYIDRLVSIIRPQKLIFLGVDGVAPRAKVNQQRARRFKSGRARLELEAEARERGEEVPEDAFDSNCITPGTEFLQRLDHHLRFYVRKKISEDPLWQKPQVILSGPLVPGEGEHKVMEYLRWAKKDPNYQPNQKHCLYGLDADLIMLALVTHEPHFFLLREKVSYGSRGRGRPSREVLENPCAEGFTLLNVGLLRESLRAEFRELKLDEGWYDLEKAIDDIIFICMLVGNDFLPPLPTLDIAEGALDNMLDIYKEILPSMQGYLHQDGELVYKNLEVFMKKIAAMEKEVLQMRAVDADMQDSRKRKQQKREARFRGKPMDKASKAGGGSKADGAAGEDGEGNSSEPTMMSTEARSLILFQEGDEGLNMWKKRYYTVKLECEGDHDIRTVTKEYIRGVTWVLQYYYRGVVSWDWYYPYHYAPMASEINALVDLKKPKYNYGKPFNPFQQLLAVMPASSAKLFPEVYQELILNDSSPLRNPVNYFPTDFDLDMEGKRADWEGIVLIPFIDEKVLLEAERTHVNPARLKKEELERNTLGPVVTFYYDEKSKEDLFCQSTLPQQFTNVVTSKSRVMMVAPPPPFPANEKGFTSQMTKGTTTGLGNPKGFPTLQTLKVTSRLDAVGVDVFGTASKKKSLVLELKAPGLSNLSIKLEQIGKALLGERCFVNWPYLKESTVTGISDNTGYFDTHGFRAHSSGGKEEWEYQADKCIDSYLTKQAIDVGEASFFVHARDCVDMTRMPDGSIEKHFSDKESMHPIQVILRSDPFEKGGKSTIQTAAQKKVMQSLKSGSKVLYLSEPYYGCVGTILKGGRKKQQDPKLSIQIVPNSDAEKQNMSTCKRIVNHSQARYFPDTLVTKKVGISFRVLGMMTSMVNAKDSKGKNVGLGLCLKSRSQGAIVPDYCKVVVRGENTFYEYTAVALQVLQQYKLKFPWVFDAVAKEGKKDYYGNDFFPSLPPEEADKMLYSVSRWLKQLPLARRPMVKQEAKVAPEEAIRALQQAIIPTGSKSPMSAKPVHLENISPMNVLTPPDPSLPRPYLLKVGQFAIGDRVVSVGGHPNAPPFGSLGVVVSVYPNGLVEAIFDSSYLGGKDLYGRCKKGTGNIVPPFCLVNKTRPVDLTQVKKRQQQQAKGSGKPKPQAQKQQKQQQKKKATQQVQQKMEGMSVSDPPAPAKKPEEKLANAGNALLKMLQKK